MRIVGGAFRGRKLIAPKGIETRPTSDRVRESVFNVIEHGLADWAGALAGAAVVDLFAGSGALGLEAMSRGARRATFIDRAGAAAQAVKKNAAACGVWRDVTILKLDAAHLPPPPLAAEAPCQIAFLDAPYGAGLTLPALLGLRQRGWLEAGGLTVAEIGAEDELPPQPGYDVLDARTYGAAKVVFLQTRD
ncbi:MAG: 16S rRNA (guanine(966)-N(2))-methyltransferase RsmD [Magnetovibrio sp.]|nr:16S rRNA (guanine(966)-N(2))-methyltransferase RsmD [Magnetovibrio sp.]